MTTWCYPDTSIGVGQNTDGLLYGYSVFTSFRYPLAKSFLQQSCQRLYNNAQEVGLAIPPIQMLEAWIIDCLAVTSSPLRVRCTVFPKEANINQLGHPHPKPRDTHIILQTQALPTPLVNAITLKTVHYEKPFPQIKSGSLIDSLLLKQSVQKHGYDEALWVNTKNQMTETTIANIFFIEKETLYTPNPTIDGCLPGIMRQFVLDAAKALHIPVVEKARLFEELPNIQSAFLTNAVQGIIPVSQINTMALKPFPYLDQLLDRIQTDFFSNNN